MPSELRQYRGAKRYEEAAECIREHFRGKPVHPSVVASDLDVTLNGARSLLHHARRRGLVEFVPHKGWLPAGNEG